MKIQVDVLGSAFPNTDGPMVSVVVRQHLKKKKKKKKKKKTERAEFRSCVKAEVAVLGSRP